MRGLSKPAQRLKRDQIREADFEPQTHKPEPNKRSCPALIIQTNLLNAAGYATTVVIPGTTQIYRDTAGGGYPLRTSIRKIAKVDESSEETGLLIDQIRAISNQHFLGEKPLAELTRPHFKRVEEALRLLTGE